jgi:hypothetical protein
VGTFPADIDIEAINVQPNLLPILSESSVKIRISAQPQVWQLLSSDVFQARIDLQGKAEGILQMPVDVTSSNPEVQILKVIPDKIQVNLEKITDHQTQVELQIKGTPKDDNVVTGYQVEPETVTVKTAVSIYKKIAKVAARVNVEAEKNSFERIYQLVALDNQGNSLSSVSFEPREVNVAVQIGKSGNVKTVGIRPNIIDSPQEGYLVDSISVNPAVLTIRGTASTIYGTEYISTSPISIKNKSQDLKTQALLVFPAGITSLDDIEKVAVIVKIKQAAIESQVESDNFNYLNLASNLEVVNTSPSSVHLKIKGPIDIINNIKEGEIKLKFDLTDHQTAGQFDVNLREENIQLPVNIELIEFTPQIFKIQLSGE